MSQDDYEHFMDIAIVLAKEAAAIDEVPVGAVVVSNGEIIAKAHNQREGLGDPTAHAEILAIRQAAAKLGTWRLSECEIYVTKEPCPMCAGAISQARFSRLIYGVTDQKAGYAGTLHNTVQDDRLNWKTEVVSGVREEENRRLLQEFFKRKRA